MVLTDAALRHKTHHCLRSPHRVHCASARWGPRVERKADKRKRTKKKINKRKVCPVLLGLPYNPYWDWTDRLFLKN